MDVTYKTTLEPNSTEYPASLRHGVEHEHPPAITALGNLDLLDRTLLGFFCSVRCPGDTILKTYDLARSLRSTDVTLIGGFQSAMEKEFLDLLLRGSASVVLCPARGLGTMRIPKSWMRPLTDGRLLLLSFFDDNIRRPTTSTAAKRNDYVVTLAKRLLIAHAEKDGKLEKLCKKHLSQGKLVFSLESPENIHLSGINAIPIQTDNLIPIVGSHDFYSPR